MKVIVSFLVLILFAANLWASSPENTCELWRKNSGKICHDCRTLVECKKSHAGYEEIIVDRCEAGTHCSDEEGACVRSHQPCTDWDRRFDCTSDGIYPDPYNATKFYLCYGGNSLLTCPVGSVYTARTGTCSLPNDNDLALRWLWRCSVPGEKHPWPQNPNFYYVCEPSNNGRFLFPKMFRCSGSQIFNGIRCDDSRISTNSNDDCNCTERPIKENYQPKDIRFDSSDGEFEFVCKLKRKQSMLN